MEVMEYNNSKKETRSDCSMAELLTVKELQEKLSMSRSSIYRLRKNQGLPYYEVGGKVLFDLDEVKKWMKEQQKA